MPNMSTVDSWGGQITITLSFLKCIDDYCKYTVGHILTMAKRYKRDGL